MSDGPGAAVAASATVLTLQHHAAIRRTIDELVAAGYVFDADHVHARLPAGTSAWLDAHPQVLGGYMQHVVRQCRVRFVGWTDSHRRPGRPQRVWACTR